MGVADACPYGFGSRRLPIRLLHDRRTAGRPEIEPKGAPETGTTRVSAYCRHSVTSTGKPEPSRPAQASATEMKEAAAYFGKSWQMNCIPDRCRANHLRLPEQGAMVINCDLCWSPTRLKERQQGRRVGLEAAHDKPKVLLILPTHFPERAYLWSRATIRPVGGGNCLSRERENSPNSTEQATKGVV